MTFCRGRFLRFARDFFKIFGSRMDLFSKGFGKNHHIFRWVLWIQIPTVIWINSVWGVWELLGETGIQLHHGKLRGLCRQCHVFVPRKRIRPYNFQALLRENNGLCNSPFIRWGNVALGGSPLGSLWNRNSHPFLNGWRVFLSFNDVPPKRFGVIQLKQLKRRNDWIYTPEDERLEHNHGGKEDSHTKPRI